MLIVETVVRIRREHAAGKAIKAIAQEIVKDADKRDRAMCEKLVEDCFASQDYIEGRRAFMEKRKPAFTGT